jgi:hypothetical protein
MEDVTMKTDFEKFLSLCNTVKKREAITYGVNEIEKELLNILNFIKEHKLYEKEYKNFLIEIVRGLKLYPLQIIIFCMRELQWEEIKNAAISEKNNTNDWRIISSMNDILQVYETEWEDADMYQYYSKSS